MLCGISIAFNSLGDVLGLVSCQCGSEHRQVLVGFQSTEALGRFQHAGGRPAQRITALRHRFTLRLTRRTVPIMFSIALVQASERRSDVGSLSRTMVSISASRRALRKYWRRRQAPGRDHFQEIASMSTESETGAGTADRAAAPPAPAMQPW
jgi:hypothetical protein